MAKEHGRCRMAHLEGESRGVGGIQKCAYLFWCENFNRRVGRFRFRDFGNRVFGAVVAHEGVGEERAEHAAVIDAADRREPKRTQPVVAFARSDRGDNPLPELALKTL